MTHGVDAENSCSVDSVKHGANPCDGPGPGVAGTEFPVPVGQGVRVGTQPDRVFSFPSWIRPLTVGQGEWTVRRRPVG